MSNEYDVGELWFLGIERIRACLDRLKHHDANGYGFNFNDRRKQRSTLLREIRGCTEALEEISG